MSKAKELAREIQTELELGDLNVGPRSKQLMYNLVDAVLSEPEPLRGWIEVTKNSTGMKELINLRHVYSIEIYDDVCRVWFDNENDKTVVKESYDSIKQKIKEAS